MKKLLVATAITGLAIVAACTDPSASAAPAKHSKAHSKTHKATSRVITAKGHTEGTDRYFLTLKGAKLPASVTKRTFKRCHIDDRYPACADG
jgi:hypothetical protein